ncbi:MAG: hypothetical protein LQ351_002822 [Letrouitia transgressa]|nr:MAG: hypothetical protein LQ351_002822 [Letrouitia transgressa]
MPLHDRLEIDRGILNGKSESSPDQAMTLTVLGCGTLGIAILSGILSSLSDSSKNIRASPSPSGATTPLPHNYPPPRVPSRFIACVTRSASANRVRAELSSFSSSLTVLQNQNLKGVREADVIILACKPKNIRDGLLREEGMAEALQGKLLVSILAGMTGEQLEDNIYSAVPSPIERCRVVRVMPNTASLIRESMTVIGTYTPPLPSHQAALVTWIFTRIGRVVHLPPYMMDASTALCGSGPAFFALILEAMADGAVAMGLPRAEAQLMAAQTMKGTAEMVQNGQHPALLREQVCTPGGCTAGGLQVLEDGKVRASVATGVRKATDAASRLGRGEQGVNAPR